MTSYLAHPGHADSVLAGTPKPTQHQPTPLTIQPPGSCPTTTTSLVLAPGQGPRRAIDITVQRAQKHCRFRTPAASPSAPSDRQLKPRSITSPDRSHSASGPDAGGKDLRGLQGEGMRP
ncbi:hypothetical protein K505DRAFT_337333 [Melanomma pulvis-pyrius CBS 109.77]|uniref:Uncharacterized protein n=1 Tax=Melanomma pulvis-pyrius CBS 109.77 TaxID=1314802 RepID=A0A6A6XBQ8_9PLEO|nr:hypothetical protein K505DRAFT_337333 [Melanomma pulvis-pyrius CBS 109.77]